MKKLFFFTVFCSLILGGCNFPTDEPANPLEGFWEMQYSEYTTADTLMIWKEDKLHKMTKAYGKENIIFLNMRPSPGDSAGLETRGGKGTYELRGDTLIETIELWPGEAMIGESIYFKFEIRGDSFIQKGPITEYVPLGWEDFHLYEVYTRRE